MEACPKVTTFYEFMVILLRQFPQLLGWVVAAAFAAMFVYGAIKLAPGWLAALKQSNEAITLGAEAVETMNSHVSITLDELNRTVQQRHDTTLATAKDIAEKVEEMHTVLQRVTRKKKATPG